MTDLQLDLLATQYGRKDGKDFTFRELLELNAYEKFTVDYDKLLLNISGDVMNLVSAEYFENVTGERIKNENNELRYGEDLMKNNIFYKKLEDLKKDFTGTWYWEYEGVQYDFIFNDDNTGSYEDYDGSIKEYRYNLSGNVLTFIYPTNSTPFEYKLSVDKKEFQYTDQGYTFHFKKR